MDVQKKAERAQFLLQDEVLLEALNGLLDEKVALLTGKTASLEEVQAARHAVWALEDVTGRLQSFVDDAKMAAHRAGKAGPK